MNSRRIRKRRPQRDFLLAVAIIALMQAVVLFLLRPFHAFQRETDPAGNPYIPIEHSFLRLEDRLLPVASYLGNDQRQYVRIYPYLGKIDYNVINRYDGTLFQGRLPGNVDIAALGALDVDGDRIAELVYARLWPEAARGFGGTVLPDSLWICWRKVDGPEHVLERLSASELAGLDDRVRSISMRIPTLPNGVISAAGPSRFALFLYITSRKSARREIRLFTREEQPFPVAQLELSNYPMDGFWSTLPSGSEVLTVGTAVPHSMGYNTAVDSGKATPPPPHPAVVQIDANGRLLWMYTFAGNSGEVHPYPPASDQDGIFLTVLAEQFADEHNPSGTTLAKLRLESGAVVDSTRYPSRAFFACQGSDVTSDGPVGLIGRTGESLILVQGDGEATQAFHPEVNAYRIPDPLYLLHRRDRTFMAIQGDASRTLLLDLEGHLAGQVRGIPMRTGTNEILADDGAVRTTVPVYQGGQYVRIVDFIHNPDPLWMFQPYHWPIMLLVLPYVALIALFYYFRFRLVRRLAKRRLVESYRRLQDRFRRRSEELAQANRYLQTQIEERRRAVTGMQRHQEHLEAIFNSVQDGMITLDGGGTIIRVNKAFGAMFELDPETVVGTRLRHLFPEQADELDQLLSRIDHRLKGDAGPGSIEMQLDLPQAKRGSMRVVRVSAVPLENPNRNLRESMILFRDITREVRLERQVQDRYRFHNLVGQSAKMQGLYGLIEEVARSDSTVLITGESGTGKELVANAIHVNSPRASGPFVPVHCAALSEHLLTSELFGHVRGAFTGATRDKVGYFQKAHGGTLFLDEFGDISPSVQVKLLRVLNDKVIERVGDTKEIKVDVRILLATNRDLEEEIRKGAFREDLYYRINVMRIHLPPLRERKEDVPLLVDHLLAQIRERSGKEVNDVSQPVLDLLVQYDWPGNVRELRNALERATIVCRGHTILVEHLPPEVRELRSIGPTSRTAPASYSPTEALTEEEQTRQALKKHAWNVAGAARELSISRQTLYRRMRRYGLERPDV